MIIYNLAMLCFPSIKDIDDLVLEDFHSYYVNSQNL